MDWPPEGLVPTRPLCHRRERAVGDLLIAWQRCPLKQKRCVSSAPLKACALLASLFLFGCGGSTGSSVPGNTKDPAAPAQVVADLKPLATPPGGMAFYTPILKLEPGADVTECTYLSTITDKDLFVHTTRGTESKMGHHALLFYSTTSVEPHTEVCAGQSMETLRQMIGGAGGEGQATWTPPDNVGTIVPKGSQFVLQSHWINTSVDTLDVQAMMITEPGKDGPGRIEAGTLTVLDVGFQVPPMGAGNTTTECTFDSAHHLLMSIGHEHEWGTHVHAEVTRTSGAVEQLFDRAFSPHDTFDPPINGYSVDQPLVFSKGDKIRMSCEWQNTTTEALGFPREMCVFFGFTMDPGDARCLNGGWLTAGPPGDAGAGPSGPPCAVPGAPGNDAGVGKYCTAKGGECAGSGATICIADYSSSAFGDFCTKLCSSDTDCGAGALCLGTGSTPKVCMPAACVGGAAPDAGAP
jgi:hypothetical protein